MQIKTREQEVTPRELLSIYYWNTRSLGLVILVLFFIGLFSDASTLIFLPLIFVVFLLIATRRSVHSKANRIFFVKRHHEMDDDFLCTYLVDGGMGKMAWGHFHRCVRFRESFLLFLSETQFHYIPYSMFYGDADRQVFESFLREKGLLQDKSKAEPSWPVRLAFEAALFLMWFIFMVVGLVLFFTKNSDNVSAFLMSLLLVVYPAFQIVRLARLIVKKRRG